MRRSFLLGGTALIFASSLVVAQESPESILPPGFDETVRTPAPQPTSNPGTVPVPDRDRSPNSVSNPVIQELPDSSGDGYDGGAGSGRPRSSSSARNAPGGLPGNLPSISELERLNDNELDELLGLKPKFDMPPQARRSMEVVGVLSQEEGGLPSLALARQPASLVQATLAGIDGQLVSRWGHILLRRALASRLAAPEGMDPAYFAALRASALNKIGEHRVARALVQDVDAENWNEPLIDAGLAAYIGSMDVVGACPIMLFADGTRDDAESEMLQNICYAYSGQTRRSRANITKALISGDAPEIDLRLTQRIAGVAGSGGRAVTIEWDGVDELTPWRFALASALGLELPDRFVDDLAPYYQRAIATAPMVPTPQRVAYADRAAGEGILSSATMVDLYSELYTDRQDVDESLLIRASQLRNAYVADDPVARLTAIQRVWGTAKPEYGRLVLTAYAAARLDPLEEFAPYSEELVASMLTAGLDNNALRWDSVVEQGGSAWGQLVLAAPQTGSLISEGQFDEFWSDDDSTDDRRAKFLLAGLGGLERIDPDDFADLSGQLGVDFSRQTKWSFAIDQAANYGNSVLVAYLAGLGMQGSSWEMMTPRHLYHIVSALNRVGLSAEARMIAAEAVARG